MKRWWNREVLRFVDAWACREGTPEDDEDANARIRTLRDVADDEIFTANAYPLNNGQNENSESHTTARVHQTSGTNDTHDWIELNLYEARAPEDEEAGN